MDRKNLLQRFEQQLEKVIEQPFMGQPPFDVKELKERLLAAVEETKTPYVPDRWFVRLPEALRARDGEVRAWVDAVWRSLVASVDPENWVSGTTPQIDVTYDRNLSGEQMMVGYEFSVSSGPLYGTTGPSRASRARNLWDTQVRGRLVPAKYSPDRRLGVAGRALRLVAVVSIVLGVGLGIAITVVDLGRSMLSGASAEAQRPPSIEAPRIAWPQIEVPRVQLPSVRLPDLSPQTLFGTSVTEYTARTDLHVRREPTVKAESLRVIPRGERVRVMSQQIVEGEVVQGEGRWADVTPLAERLSGQGQFIWLGGLEPAPR